MRIIAGLYKGKKLIPPKDQSVRPTTDRVREFVFDYLADWAIDAHVLDLFSGSGALGIEALSRGAKTCTFVDADLESVNLIRKNLQLINNNSMVIKRSAESFLKSNTLAKYDLVFCDPPYRFENFNEILQTLNAHSLNDDALIVYESDRRVDGPAVAGLEIIKVKKMGNTKITVYQKNAS